MNIILNKNAVLFALLGGLVVGICQNKSFADPIGKDLKNITATICKTKQIQVAQYNSGGRISNSSTLYPLITNCPLIMDNISPGPDLSEVYVLFNDAHPDLDVKCNLTYYDGNIGFFKNFKLKKLSSHSVLYIKDDKIDKSTNRSYSSRSTYSVSCEIPPKYDNAESSIIAINYGEKVRL